jgi:hypothetical protein
MTEMVTSGSMSGGGKRSDGLLGESDYERRRSLQAPPALHATAPFLDSTEPIIDVKCGRPHLAEHFLPGGAARDHQKAGD